jgi:hypothetical protein
MDEAEEGNVVALTHGGNHVNCHVDLLARANRSMQLGWRRTELVAICLDEEGISGPL